GVEPSVQPHRIRRRPVDSRACRLRSGGARAIPATARGGSQHGDQAGLCDRRRNRRMSATRPASLALYRFAMQAATPFADLLLHTRLKRGKEHATRLPERRGQTAIPRPSGALVWLHGASVGELVAALPLVERIRARGLGVLVTSGTVTSANIAHQRLPS